MKIIKADNKHYIRLGDLDHLLRCMSLEIYGKYTRNEEGTYVQENGAEGMTLKDIAWLKAIRAVMTRVLQREINACETEQEVWNLEDRIESEFYRDKYVVMIKEMDEDGHRHNYLFRKYCEGAMRAKMEEEGKSEKEILETLEDRDGDPVFTEDPMQADFMEDHEMADATARYIKSAYGLETEVEPAWFYNHKTVKKVLDAIFNEPEDEKEEAGEDE